MKILVACEESGVVTEFFRIKGHEAYSCDILETSGKHPEWHIIKTLHDIKFYKQFDMIIAFPPCTDLASSGARWFKEKQADGRQQASIDFFLGFIEFTQDVPKVCIENPIGIMSSIYQKPSQIIQPWQFGHGETKATCLWLKGLPLLKPTNVVKGREQRIWKMGPSKDRAKERSKTYSGIAFAMAEQWG